MFQEQIRQIVCVLIRLNFLKTKMIDFNLQVKVPRGANFTDGRTDGRRTGHFVFLDLPGTTTVWLCSCTGFD